ncbi:hypothetical protein AMECASPLE_026310 [Ameca splendens]|uniref:Uncharacterized protein n=1 Tax=Ameca splendens TaxID=208324 RepID=A0ABV0Y5G3_9TELE
MVQFGSRLKKLSEPFLRLTWVSAWQKLPQIAVATDGERQTDGTDASRKRDARSSAGHHKSEDTSDSREDEAAA